MDARKDTANRLLFQDGVYDRKLSVDRETARIILPAQLKLLILRARLGLPIGKRSVASLLAIASVAGETEG